MVGLFVVGCCFVCFASVLVVLCLLCCFVGSCLGLFGFFTCFLFCGVFDWLIGCFVMFGCLVVFCSVW